MKTRMKYLVALAATAVAVTVLAGCTSSNSGGVSSSALQPTSGSTLSADAGTISAPDPNGSLAKAAKAEGSLTWYAPALGGINNIGAAFTAKYGVKVNIVSMANTDLQTKFTSEASVGAPQSDVVTTGYTAFFQDSINKGYLIPMTKAVSDFPGTYPSEYIKDNGQTPIVSIAATGFAYNSDVIKDPPKTIADLADPKYAGQILNVNVKASTGYQQFWDAMLTKYGASVLDGIAANTVRTYDQVPELISALGAGEGSIAAYASAGLIAPLMAKDPAIKFVIPDFTTGVDFGLGVTAKSLHPQAAKLFAEWLLSTPGQQSFVDANKAATPLIGGTLPSEYVLPADTLSASRLQEIYKDLRAN